MKKMELRGQGFSEITQQTKETIATMIWVISTILIIALNIIAAAANTLDRTNRIFDFFHIAAYSIDEFFRTYAVTSAIYLILWVLMMFVMYLITKKSDRVNKFVMTAILFVLILAVAFSVMMLISENYGYYSDERQPAFFGLFDVLYQWLYSKIEFAAIAVMLVVFEFIYLGVKLAATRVVCSDKNSIRFKFLHGMPVCYCTEAFRPWQTAAIYLVPFAFINSMLFILNIRSDNGHIVSGLFMAFISSFDMSAVVYALRFKVKGKADYVSIDHHIYEVTLFQK